MNLYPSSLNQPKTLETVRNHRWLLGILIALLFHSVFLLNPGIFMPKVVPAPRVDLTEISAEKLDAIRKQWKQRPILLNTDSSPKDPNAPVPKDARYDSDRNRTVPREERARITNVVPKAGGATGVEQSERPSTEAAGKKAEKTAKAIPLKNLSNFALRPEESPTLRSQRRAKIAEERAANEAEAGGGARGETVRGGDQALSDKDLPEGARNILNTQESKYYSFYARIHETLGPLWQSLVGRTIYSKPFSMGEYTTQVEVIMDDEGNFEECRIQHSSGSRELDAVVEEAWKRLKRFPNPPRDLLGPDGKIHMGWSFTVNLDRQTGVQFAPPRRNY